MRVPDERLKGLGRSFVETPGLQVFAVLCIFLVGVVTLPGFGGGGAIRSMLVLASFLGIAAVGQTLTVLLAGIDLSVAALVGAGNVLTAQLYGAQHVSFVLTAIIVVVFGALVGAINGFVAKRFNVTPLIVTLAVASIVGGGILVWTGGNLTGSAPAWLGTFTSPAAKVWVIPVPGVVVCWVVIAVLLEVFLRRSGLGRRIFAAGSNPRAAELMLVNETWVWTLCFGIGGAFAAIAGLLLAGFTGAALFTVGDPYLFTTIAAVVVGGTSMLGGRGSYVRTILGALALTEISTMLVGYGLSSAAQQAVFGGILVAVVATYAREPSIRSRI